MGTIFKVLPIVSILFILSNGATCTKKEHTDLGTHHGPIHTRPVDCAEVKQNGETVSGVKTIYPRNKLIPCGEVKVHCDMYTDGGGWTVIQRRGDLQRSPDYFYKTWDDYKTGFGDVRSDFWLGNDIIHAMTNQKRYSVRFDLKADYKKVAFALYDTFWIENEELKYRLHITGYRGTAGDSMAYHHNMPFSTRDRNNGPSSDCAKESKGGWWYNDCAEANLNGLHLNGNFMEDMLNGTMWKTWLGYNVSLTSVEIKIRPYDF